MLHEKQLVECSEDKQPGEGKGKAQQGREALAFTYVKCLELEERIEFLTHAMSWIKTTWQKLEGN